jgi:hypothetical protein
MGKFDIVDVDLSAYEAHLHARHGQFLRPGDVIKFERAFVRPGTDENNPYAWETIVTEGSQALVISLSTDDTFNPNDERFETCMVMSDHKITRIPHWWLEYNCEILYRGD